LVPASVTVPFKQSCYKQSFTGSVAETALKNVSYGFAPALNVKYHCT